MFMEHKLLEKAEAAMAHMLDSLEAMGRVLETEGYDFFSYDFQRIETELELQIALLKMGLEKGCLTADEIHYIKGITPIVDVLRSVRLKSNGSVDLQWEDLKTLTSSQKERFCHQVLLVENTLPQEWIRKLVVAEMVSGRHKICSQVLQDAGTILNCFGELEGGNKKESAERQIKQWTQIQTQMEHKAKLKLKAAGEAELIEWNQQGICLEGAEEKGRFSYLKGRSDLLAPKGKNDRNYARDGVHKYIESTVYIETNRGSGTGVLFHENGYLLTCAHVVNDAEEIKVLKQNADDFVMAEIVGFLEELDLAVLQMENDDGVYAQLGSLDELPAPGEDIVLLGYPFGSVVCDDVKEMNISFTRGYISSNQKRKGITRTFLDIAARGGNSGSPVVSARTGHVLGILNGCIYKKNKELTEEINFMTPIQYLTEFF